MPDQNTVLTREELFALVWSMPTTRIAKELGVVTYAVSKACKLLKIPRPTSGHWVKVEHGQAPSKPALPPLPHGAESSVTLSKLMASDQTPSEGKAPQSSTPSSQATFRWHFAVQKTRAALQGGTVDSKYGTIIPKREVAHLGTSVTRASMDRALGILNTLAWLLEGLGFSFQMPEKAGSRITLTYTETNTVLDFFLKEDVERYERELRPDEKDKDPFFIFNRWKYRQTGRLKLLISEYHPEGARKSWGDGKHAKLEDKVTDAAPGFVVCAKGKHAQALEWAERQRRWEEEARLEREKRERAAEEQKRRDVLLSVANTWRQTMELQAFREACEAKLRDGSTDRALSSEHQRWLSWVDEVIHATDPLSAERLNSLVGAQPASRVAGH